VNADRILPTQERIKELLSYDPDTGVFTWRVNRGKVRAGDPTGCPDTYGYLVIGVDRALHRSHRLAVLYMTGAWPTSDVDHINGDPQDNRWANLRSASRTENNFNTGLRCNNKSGRRGVHWNPLLGKWRAGGRLRGKTVHLGCFDSLDEAAAVAETWRRENHGAFYRAPEEARATSQKTRALA
jgi:hypothetical protein